MNYWLCKLEHLLGLCIPCLSIFFFSRKKLQLLLSYFLKDPHACRDHSGGSSVLRNICGWMRVCVHTYLFPSIATHFVKIVCLPPSIDYHLLWGKSYARDGLSAPSSICMSESPHLERVNRRDESKTTSWAYFLICSQGCVVINSSSPVHSRCTHTVTVWGCITRDSAMLRLWV